jgi:hypothetical protein
MTEPYGETIHQAKFAALVGIDEAMSCRSFRKLVDDVRRILEKV